MDRGARWSREQVTTLFLLASFVSSTAAYADIQIVLKKDFIEKFKNRATISTKFKVAHASKIHPAKDDGDIHIAGVSSDIGLPAVAEIMNAKQESAAVQSVHHAESSDTPVDVSGAWRIWCEHGGIGEQVQGDAIPVPADSNPDHVFEIHPVTVFDGHDVTDSYKSITGYKPKDAMDSFIDVYEARQSIITPGDDSVTIQTEAASHNYVEFVMEILDEEQKVVDDGRLLFARVYEPDSQGACELLLQKRRMVFVKDTPPEKKVKTLKKGDQLRVLGIPRVDLALISWRVKCSEDPACLKKNPDVLHWSLPYEIIVVGVLGSANCQAP